MGMLSQITCLGSCGWKRDWKVPERWQRQKDLLWGWKEGLLVQEKSVETGKAGKRILP